MRSLWGETGPGTVWHKFMQAYYGSRKPADWTRPADVQTGFFCKDTGAPTDQAAAGLTVSDLLLKSAPLPPPAPCAPPVVASEPGASPPAAQPSNPPVATPAPSVVVATPSASPP